MFFRHQGFWRKWNLTKFYLHTKFGEPMSTGGRVMAIYVFSKWQSPPSWIFAEVKCGVMSVSGTSVLVSGLNFVWVGLCAIATELWPFKWIFEMAAAAILDFSELKFDVIGSHGIYLHTKFCEAMSTGGRIMAIYVFSKLQSAAILDFCGSKIWRYFCFRDVGFSLWAKFCANMCNCDRVMVVQLNF